MYITKFFSRGVRAGVRRLKAMWYMLHDAWCRHKLRMGSSSRMYHEWSGLTAVQLMSVGRHEGHRIEKAFYNGGLDTKAAYYVQCRDRLLRIITILTETHGVQHAHPVIQWMQAILDSYEDFGGQFVEKRRAPAPDFKPESYPAMLDLLRRRRSCRVWAKQQPDENEWRTIALKLIDAARWAPSSGNRQPWRFKIMIDPADKEQLRGLKEPHCLAAPLLIFIGMDRSVYGALGINELGVYIDGGAVVQQMIMAANAMGLGTCWNHFAKDLIYARPANPPRYRRFSKAMGIPKYIEPIAILAVGKPEYIPPVPARLEIEELLL